MPPCHTTPFIRPGIVIDATIGAGTGAPEHPPMECCDFCGSARLEWRKCKLVCADCRQINKSCADL